MGEEVTANLRTIREVPLRLAGKGHAGRLTVRGEVYMTRSGFERATKPQLSFGTPKGVPP